VKAQLRKNLHRRLAGIPPAEVVRKSRTICDHIAACEPFASAEVIMVYLPIVGEVDVSTLAMTAWGLNKSLVAPTACGTCRSMRTFLCTPGDLDLFCPTDGLRMPIRHTEEVDPGRIDLIVAPGLGFDRRGNRLGRGGGFYDRFLARPEVRATTAGVAFVEQIIPDVPMEPTDRPVDLLVSDEGVIYP
jgi:5-formyltetrahydrofolate cyclo-ligase